MMFGSATKQTHKANTSINTDEFTEEQHWQFERQMRLVLQEAERQGQRAVHYFHLGTVCWLV